MIELRGARLAPFSQHVGRPRWLLRPDVFARLAATTDRIQSTCGPKKVACAFFHHEPPTPNTVETNERLEDAGEQLESGPHHHLR